RELAGALVPEPPREPLDWLRRAHEAQHAPDPARVHPSWFVRALQEESPPVRRAVLEATPEPLRSELIRGLDLPPPHPPPTRAAAPGARPAPLALGTERLVGALPPHDDDPPAIRSLTTLGPFALYRLFRLCGLAKRAIVPGASIFAARPRMA